MAKPPLIYHYTSLSSGIAILASNSIYATHVRFLNDSSEYDFGLAHFKESVRSYWKNTIAGIKKQLMLPKRMTGHSKAELAEIFKDFFGSYVQPFTDGYMKAVHDSIIRRGVYAACFCRHDSTEEIGNGILSQWRGYASGGLAIGFRRPELELTLKKHLDSRSVSGFSCGEIMYVGHTPGIEVFIRQNLETVMQVVPEYLKMVAKRIDLKQISKNDLEEFRHALNNDSVRSELGKMRQKLQKMSARVAPIPALIKDHSFREERETRILVWPASDDESATLGVRFLSTKSIIKPYLELSSDKKLPIAHVLVGPHPEKERRAEAIRLALNHLGFKANVTCSKIPVTM